MNRVVVTGLGLVSPLGLSVGESWASMAAGLCGIGPITRFDASAFKVKVAAEVKGFDPLRYMDRAEARRSDLFAQYAVAAADEAVADSGLRGLRPERFGVYIGSGVGGIGTLVAESERYLREGPRRVSPLLVPMMIANMAAGLVAIRHGAKGPSLPVVTACATASHAIGEAFRAIAGGYADVILAGGAEAPLVPLAVAGFASSMALSLREDPLDACTPFDRRRDGFVMGEGAGVLVLESFAHARARGARAYAEICGYGNTCDAYHITAPLSGAQEAARAIAMSMEEGGILGGERLYINAHGTGTPLNDGAETLAIRLALGDSAYRTHVSSTKSMTGHMLGAAGAAEAVACIMALSTGTVPPTIGYRELDPDCDLDYVPNAARKADIRFALSVSLGFGGHNACLAFRGPEAL